MFRNYVRHRKRGATSTVGHLQAALDASLADAAEVRKELKAAREESQDLARLLAEGVPDPKASLDGHVLVTKGELDNLKADRHADFVSMKKKIQHIN